ncbi:MAG: hypothetical protein WCP10_10145 [Desulfuromonadales bacterium]
MKAGWETRTLAEVCQIKPPKSEARRILAGTDLVSFVPMEYLGIDDKILIPRQEKPLADVAGSYTYFADGDVLLAKITPCFENGKLKTIEISFPKSVAKQLQIVEKLDSLREETLHLEAVYQQKLAALDALKKSLLDQAFTGAL